MKKYFLSIVALAGMLFATSCQESLVEPQMDGTTTFTVQLPDGMGTKAIGDAANTNKLYVQVYNANFDDPCIYSVQDDMENGKFEVSLTLIQDQTYGIIFWAQNENSKYDVGDLRKIDLNIEHHNSELGAAFYHTMIFTPDGQGRDITLRRPFAQLNLGTSAESLDTDVSTSNIELGTSKVIVTGIASSFNTVEGKGVDPITYTTNDVDVLSYTTDPLNVGNINYHYISMDYLPVVDNESLVTVQAYVTTDAGDIEHSFTNVPVKKNYRTNIVGNLISSTTDFVVTIEEGFVDENNNLNPDNNILVVENAAAAQEALDNAKPGDVISLAAGVNYGTLKIRAVEGKAHTTSVDYFTTKYTKELLRKVENLTIIGAPGAKVDAIQMVSTYNTENDKICYFIDVQNLVIDGIEFTDKAKQSEAFCSPLDIKLKCINVNGLTLKNCKLNGYRDNMFLLYFFNQQDSQSQFATAAKNITISGNTVSGIAGLCELREAENVTVSDNIINNTYNNPIKLGCNSGKAYSGNVNIIGNNADMVRGAFVVIGDAGDADVVIKNNTITNYLGTDPTNFIKIYSSNKVAVIENNILINRLVASAAELQTAIDGATGDYVIALGADIEGDVDIYQKKGLNLVIDGMDHQYRGTIYYYGTRTVNDNCSAIIKNVRFVTDDSDRNFIYSAKEPNNILENHNPCNLSVEECSFEGPASANTVVPFRVANGEGGFTNLTFKNCEANNVHSFVQGNILSMECLNVKCEGWEGVVNINSGFVSLNFDSCEFISKADNKYAVRVDGHREGTLTIKDSKLHAYYPIYARNLSVNNTIKFEGTNELILKDPTNQPYQIYIEANPNLLTITNGENFRSNK